MSTPVPYPPRDSYSLLGSVPYEDRKQKMVDLAQSVRVAPLSTFERRTRTRSGTRRYLQRYDNVTEAGLRLCKTYTPSVEQLTS